MTSTTVPVRAFDSAYPGSMVSRKDGSYIERADHASLAAALLETIEEQRRRIEDLEAALTALRQAAEHTQQGADGVPATQPQQEKP